MAKARTDEKTATAADGASKVLPNRGHVTDNDIACRAYDLYLARGCEHGHHVDDWLQAECELREAANSKVADN